MSYILSCPNLNILDIDISIGQISILLHYGALQISTLPPTHPLTLPPYSPTNPSPYSPTNPSPYSQPFNQLHNIFHQQQTGITPRHVRNLYNGAQERGVGSCTLLKIEHVKDRDRRGRQKKITSAVEEAIVDAVTKDRYGREKHLSSLAYSSISHPRAYFEFSAKRNSAKQSPQGNPVLPIVMRGSAALERPTGFTRMHGRSSNVPLLDCQPSTLRILSL